MNTYTKVLLLVFCCYLWGTTSEVYAQNKELKIIVNDMAFTMIFVEGGSFTMGCPSEEEYNCFDSEDPQHLVSISNYYIGQTEVTQTLWNSVVDRNPSFFEGDSLPVENVSWYDCQNFILKLNKLTGKSFRLPTEAEWEYAARGGKFHETCDYSGSNEIGIVAWNWYNSVDSSGFYTTHSVKTLLPNALGIYDMSGNVSEWCNDWYDENYYEMSPSNNPLGPVSGEKRVMRGGSWLSVDDCRVSRRRALAPSYSGCRYGFGFRLVLDE